MRKRARQGEFEFRTWGGPREGAGRKRRAGRAQVAHRERAALAARYPVHVTVRLREGLPSLRREAEYRVLRAAFAAGAERAGFRMVQYSVQGNHLHFLVEAQERQALVRGVQGLMVRVAKGLNRLWGRRGSVFADRYHDRILRTPREVRHALAYVLHNGRRHGLRVKSLDRYSSAPWFDGWKEKVTVHGSATLDRPIAQARTWLLRIGWRRHRLIGVFETPGG